MARKEKKWKSFGQRVRAIREEKGLSLEDLSHETGYASDILEKIEEDKTVPPVSLVLQISRTFMRERNLSTF